MKSLKIIFSKTARPRATKFGIENHLMAFYKDCSKFGPGVKIGPAPGVTSFTKDYIVKTLRIFLSKSIRPRTTIFGMQHHLVDLYKDCSKFAPRVKIDPAPGVTSFTQDYIVNFLKVFLSETERPRTVVFGMQHHLVNLYQDC